MRKKRIGITELFDNPIQLKENQKISLDEFYGEFNKRIKLINQNKEPQKYAQECVSLTRTAIAGLASYEDFSSIQKVIGWNSAFLPLLINAGKFKSTEDFDVLIYCPRKEDSEQAKKNLINDFLPSILKTEVRDLEKYKHEDLFTVFLRTGSACEHFPSVYKTKDGKYYLIAAQEVDPKKVGLEGVVSESQKLIKIPKKFIDSNFREL